MTITTAKVTSPTEKTTWVPSGVQPATLSGTVKTDHA